MGKRGQLSLFVVLGLGLFAIIVLGYYYSNLRGEDSQEKAELELSLRADEINKYVSDCIRKSTFEGLVILGQNGGYIQTPNLISFKGTSYWYLNQVNIQPFLNQTQERLIEYVNEKVPDCVDGANASKFGFQVEKGNPFTYIDFSNNDVVVRVVYPIKASKQSFSKEFSEFYNTFDIRYRQVFEAASEVNDHLFDSDFDPKEPLKKLDYIKQSDFDIEYKNPETDIVTFVITDRKSITPDRQMYKFMFTAKLGRSELKKITQLQNNSATNPAIMPYSIFSVDKKAQLDISEGTTMNLKGAYVEYISVQQSYPNEAVSKNIPVEKENKEIKKRADLVYVLENPVYTFEPDDMVFNRQQKLTIYYGDQQGKDAKGVGILKGKKGFWVPIPSFEDKVNKKIWANILGFTEFTAVNCASQQLKKAVARQVFEPNAGCYVTLAITIIAIIAIVTIFVAGFAAIAAGAAAEAGAIGSATGVGLASSSSVFSTITAAYTAGVQTIAGAIGISTTALSVGLVALSVVSWGIGITGSVTESFYTESPENCQGFVPTCTWDVSIGSYLKDGEGECIPKDGMRQFPGGQPVMLCAQVKKCNFIQKFVCMKCSVECTAQYY